MPPQTICGSAIEFMARCPAIGLSQSFASSSLLSLLHWSYQASATIALSDTSAHMHMELSTNRKSSRLTFTGGSNCSYADLPRLVQAAFASSVRSAFPPGPSKPAFRKQFCTVCDVISCHTLFEQPQKPPQNHHHQCIRGCCVGADTAENPITLLLCNIRKFALTSMLRGWVLYMLFGGREGISAFVKQWLMLCVHYNCREAAESLVSSLTPRNGRDCVWQPGT